MTDLTTLDAASLEQLMEEEVGMLSVAGEQEEYLSTLVNITRLSCMLYKKTEEEG